MPEAPAKQEKRERVAPVDDRVTALARDIYIRRACDPSLSTRKPEWNADEAFVAAEEFFIYVDKRTGKG